MGRRRRDGGGNPNAGQLFSARPVGFIVRPAPLDSFFASLALVRLGSGIEELPDFAFRSVELPAGDITGGSVGVQGAIPMSARAFVGGVLTADKPSG